MNSNKTFGNPSYKDVRINKSEFLIYLYGLNAKSKILTFYLVYLILYNFLFPFFYFHIQ